MKVILYNMMLEDQRPFLVKERQVDYGVRKITEAKEVVDFMNNAFELNKMAEEYCYLLTFNCRSIVTGVFLISKGSDYQCIVGIREIFCRALLLGASRIVMVHNHPSGDCTPSGADNKLTIGVRDAGKFMQIPLVDHVIIGGENFFSFNEWGLLKE